ncbi:MAG: hypothetical protein ACK5RL_00545 [Acidimicrobiales bacterium]
MVLARPRGQLLDSVAGYVVDLPDDGVAFIDWDVLAVASLPLSGGERRMVDAALSLALGTPVDLQDIATGVDQASVRVLVDAISHAAGLPLPGASS